MKFIRSYMSNRRTKKLQRFRDLLAADIRYFRNNTNEGLLRQRLINMPDVVRVHTDGGLCKNYVDVQLADGFELTGYGFWMDEAIQDAGKKVVTRLKEQIGRPL